MPMDASFSLHTSRCRVDIQAMNNLLVTRGVSGALTNSMESLEEAQVSGTALILCPESSKLLLC